jgi:hypothetical protein
MTAPAATVVTPVPTAHAKRVATAARTVIAVVATVAAVPMLALTAIAMHGNPTSRFAQVVGSFSGASEGKRGVSGVDLKKSFLPAGSRENRPTRD